jgi:hypothetical protein
MGKPETVAVIGAGASGLTAAIFSSSPDTKVTLFEKQHTAARKISASGNGRCNLSNRFIDVSRYHGDNPRFVNNVFAKFGLQETIDFFYSLGIPLVEEKNGRLFPMSLEAASVSAALFHKAENSGVEIKLNRMVESIKKTENGFSLLTAGKETYRFDSVILSAGSCAWPGLGGSDSGYKLASALGHTINQPFPSILPLNIPLKSLHKLQGIKWNCSLELHHSGKSIISSEAELLFTAYGISGPAALDISRESNRLHIMGEKPEIYIDFFPTLTVDELKAIILNLIKIPDRTIRAALNCIIKKRIPEIVLTFININPEKKCVAVTENDACRIAVKLKKFAVIPGEPRGFSEAVTAAGGVITDEIDPATMESKIIKNLYLTGELLDIDGDSGGFNLQFAWSTGAIAGMSQRVRIET